MHDVGVTLHVHQVADFDGTIFTHPAQVVAAEVDEHHMFGALFLVLEHGLFQARVFGFIAAARMSSSNGAIFQLTARDSHQHLGR